MPYANREKQREYQRQWVARRRTQWLRANGPCAMCSSWENLELDHADRATKTTHRVWSFSEDRRLAELAKCQVLCTQCHKQKTHAEFALPPEHGTSTEYKNGCRCEDCRVAGVAYTMNYRAAHGRPRKAKHEQQAHG